MMKLPYRSIRTALLLLLPLLLLWGCGGNGTGDDTGTTGTDGTTPGEEFAIRYTSGAEDTHGYAPDKTYAPAGEHVTLRKNTFSRFGYTFVGWSDGEKTYLAEETISMPEGGMTLTALWKEGGSYFTLDNCDSNEGWWGTFEIVHGTDSPPEGSGYNATRGSEVLIFCNIFDSALDLSGFRETGFLHLWLWVEDETLLQTGAPTLGLIELNDGDSDTYSLSIAAQKLRTGWNELCIPMRDAVVDSGDLSNITSFRLFQYVTGTTEIRMDGMELWMPEEAFTVSFKGNGADYLLGTKPTLELNNVVSDTVISLPENLYVKNGFDFVGWSDGTKTYREGEEYRVLSADTAFTAVWEESQTYMLTYDYKTKTESRTAYEGERLLVPSDAVREGYVFSGWSDGEKVYRPGTTYTMKGKETTLTAVWEKIEDYDLLSDAVGAWELREGGSAGLAPSAVGGTTLESRWTVWLNHDTFGQVADFSTAGSMLRTENAGIRLKDRFTLSAWVMAPIREKGRRTILAQSGLEGEVVTEEAIFFDADDKTGWWGTAEIRPGSQKPAEGSGYLESTANGIVVFCVTFPEADLTPYSFTTYEPYIIGFGTARSGMGGYRGFESFLKDVPYPVPEGLSEAEIDRMAKEICSLMPEDLLAEGLRCVTAYLKGEYDCHVLYSNQYDGGYTADWQRKRMDSLGDWSRKYGGNIHMMCVEFGCMDSVTAKKYFGAAEGSGIRNEVRIRLITDLRTAFEANDIGWSYWLFNGVFTVFDPEKREMNAVTDDAYIEKAYDKALIEDALGLKPVFPRSE